MLKYLLQKSLVSNSNSRVTTKKYVAEFIQGEARCPLRRNRDHLRVEF